jgi:hypothetical protein
VRVGRGCNEPIGLNTVRSVCLPIKPSPSKGEAWERVKRPDEQMTPALTTPNAIKPSPSKGEGWERVRRAG